MTCTTSRERLSPDDPRHGTRNGYAKVGCRCDRCRKANADTERARRWRVSPPKPRPTTEERFWAKVGDRSDCWEWIGAKTGSGYGQFWYGERGGQAHRYAYEIFVGPIPTGLQLDHLCRNRACVNPVHLAPVTNRENTLRGISPFAQKAAQTHCKRGHEFTPENTERPSRGQRGCRECRRAWNRAYYARRAAA